MNAADGLLVAEVEGTLNSKNEYIDTLEADLKATAAEALSAHTQAMENWDRVQELEAELAAKDDRIGELTEALKKIELEHECKGPSIEGYTFIGVTARKALATTQAEET